MNKKLTTAPKRILLVCSIIGLTVGIVSGILMSQLGGNSVIEMDITPLNARQAMVFWSTKDPAIGYVRMGAKPFWRPTKVLQTSSEANVIHAVLLEQLPLEGAYLSVHTEDDPWYQAVTVYSIAPSQDSDANMEPES